MASPTPRPPIDLDQMSDSLTDWTDRQPIPQAVFGKLTSLRYFFYSTQFIRSGVPTSAWSAVLLGNRERSFQDATYLDVQGGIWDLFNCCLSTYDDYGFGAINMVGFWIVVWRRLQRVQGLETYDFQAYKFLPHIVHFYAKSRELGQRYSVPPDWKETADTKYLLQRLIDTWNRKTFYQTYWDPHTGVNIRPRRVGFVADDEHWGAHQALRPFRSDSETNSESEASSRRDESDRQSTTHPGSDADSDSDGNFPPGGDRSDSEDEFGNSTYQTYDPPTSEFEMITQNPRGRDSSGQSSPRLRGGASFLPSSTNGANNMFEKGFWKRVRQNIVSAIDGTVY
ncbi:hypothetical protein F4805DRAFT_476081 [Annulohypoxylon moriforme]|nr:hypothetical protein F4805DRAFT_476081 [Annulohypoxylon moriforme]